MPQICPNCQSETSGKYCCHCGQTTDLSIPGFRELIHDGLGGLFSYDAKLWKTLRVLVASPGKLSTDYFAGIRGRYVSPFQLFFWLETVTFVAHRLSFSSQEEEIGRRIQGLHWLGLTIFTSLLILFATRRLKFVFHLLTTIHIWSFLMLLLFFEYSLIPPAVSGLIKVKWLGPNFPEGKLITWIAIIVMPIYLFFAIRRVYASKSWLAAIQTTVILAVALSVLYALKI